MNPERPLVQPSTGTEDNRASACMSERTFLPNRARRSLMERNFHSRALIEAQDVHRSSSGNGQNAKRRHRCVRYHGRRRLENLLHSTTDLGFGALSCSLCSPSSHIRSLNQQSHPSICGWVLFSACREEFWMVQIDRFSKIDGPVVVSHLEGGSKSTASLFSAIANSARAAGRALPGSNHGGERQGPQGRGGYSRVHHPPPQAPPWLVSTLSLFTLFLRFLRQTLILQYLLALVDSPSWISPNLKKSITLPFWHGSCSRHGWGFCALMLYRSTSLSLSLLWNGGGCCSSVLIHFILSVL